MRFLFGRKKKKLAKTDASLQPNVEVQLDQKDTAFQTVVPHPGEHEERNGGQSVASGLGAAHFNVENPLGRKSTVVGEGGAECRCCSLQASYENHDNNQGCVHPHGTDSCYSRHLGDNPRIIHVSVHDCQYQQRYDTCHPRTDMGSSCAPNIMSSRYSPYQEEHVSHTTYACNDANCTLGKVCHHTCTQDPRNMVSETTIGPPSCVQPQEAQNPWAFDPLAPPRSASRYPPQPHAQQQHRVNIARGNGEYTFTHNPQETQRPYMDRNARDARTILDHDLARNPNSCAPMHPDAKVLRLATPNVTLHPYLVTTPPSPLVTKSIPVVMSATTAYNYHPYGPLYPSYSDNTTGPRKVEYTRLNY